MQAETQKFLAEFGKLLKQTRKSLRLSQVNAAAQMNVDYRHYQNIEGGKINLRLDTFIKLIRFYDLAEDHTGINLQSLNRIVTSTTASPD